MPMARIICPKQIHLQPFLTPETISTMSFNKADNEYLIKMHINHSKYKRGSDMLQV
jgi:hypothetical protein